MYQALYRKYRPLSFDDVVGQSHITDVLKSQVDSGKLSHAYLFVGTRGTGKTSCAKILSKAVNCLNPQNGNPCNKCAACVGISDGSILDVIEIDAASNNKVEDARLLRSEAIYSPAGVKKRVYIIDEVHMLTTAAFNALLKIIEEPPAHLVFILATTELHKVPITILSRCQRFGFRRISSDEISERILNIADKENINLETEASELIARLSEGSLRDAISILDQCSMSQTVSLETVFDTMGILGRSEAISLYKAAIVGNVSEVLSIYRKNWNLGKDPAAILSELLALYRDIFVYKLAAGSKSKAHALINVGYSDSDVKPLTTLATSSQLIRSMEKIKNGISSMRTGPSPSITAEICLIELCNVGNEKIIDDSCTDLYERISFLEDKLNNAISNRDVKAAFSAEAVSENMISNEPAEDAIAAIPCSEIQNTKNSDIAAESLLSAPDNITDEKLHSDILEVQEITEKPEEPKENVKPQIYNNDITWEEILSNLELKLKAHLFAVLSNSNDSVGEVEDGQISVLLKPGFAYEILSKSEVSDAIAVSAHELSGRHYKVSIKKMTSDVPFAEKRDIDEIKKFKNIVTIIKEDNNG